MGYRKKKEKEKIIHIYSLTKLENKEKDTSLGKEKCRSYLQ
jgi:hypothetical protein